MEKAVNAACKGKFSAFLFWHACRKFASPVPQQDIKPRMRNIPLLFCWLRLYMRVSCERHAPAALPREKRISTHGTGVWVSPRACLNGCGKFRPHPNMIPGPSSPWRVLIQTALSRPTLKYCIKVKTNFIANQNEFGACVSITHTVKLKVHKIQYVKDACAELLLLFDPQQVSFGLFLPSRANFFHYLLLQPKMEPSALHIFTFFFVNYSPVWNWSIQNFLPNLWLRIHY